MKVQELLDSEDKWTQGETARDVNGKCVAFTSQDAVKWCLAGAILKCYLLKANVILDRIQDIITFNDTHNYEEVMELVRRLDI